jgi:hypothetical protein
MDIGYWWENQKERDHWEDQYMDNIKMDLERDKMGRYGLD